MIGILTALSLMWAIWGRAPANIERYLWAELVYIPFVWVVHLWVGDWHPIYACTYVLFTAMILWQICHITLDCLKSRHYRLRAAGITFILAATLTKLAYLGGPKPVSGYLAIALIEGFILAWTGTLTIFLAPYTKRPDLIFPLAVFWLVLAAYDFGWTLNWREWERINWLVPPAFGIACFSWLAYRLRAVPVEA